MYEIEPPKPKETGISSKLMHRTAPLYAFSSFRTLFPISDYANWYLAHAECKKYLRLIKYLNEESIMEQSPTLQRSIREHRLV